MHFVLMRVTSLTPVKKPAATVMINVAKKNFQPLLGSSAVGEPSIAACVCGRNHHMLQAKTTKYRIN